MTTTKDHDDLAGDDSPEGHPGWDVLNDLSDGRLSADDARTLALHLAACGECRAQHDALRALSGDAASLPAAIAPPDDLWAEVSASIRKGEASRTAGVQQSTHVGADEPAPRAANPRSWHPTPRWLAAAALILMGLSSGLTALYMRNTDSARPTIAATPETSNTTTKATTPNPLLPAAFVETERTYLASVAEVESLLAAQRGTLAPATVAIVDRALATIDVAIAEARSALLADPANRALADLLETSYRQKLDLLRRTAGLSQS